MDDAGLEDLFNPFGPITSAKVMTDERGRGKGFGFVCFKSPDDATKAVKEMHLKVVDGKPLYVGLAEKKEERLARLSQRYKNPSPMAGSAMNPMGQGMMGPPGAPMPYPNVAMGLMKGGMKGGPGVPFGGQNPMAPGGGFMPNQQMFMQGKGGMPPQGMFGGGMPPQMRGPPVGGMYPGMMQGQMMGMFPGGKGGNMMGMPMMGKGMGPGPRPPMNMAPGSKGGPPQRPMMPGQQQMRSEEPLTAAALAAAAPGMQKQMLGEKLFPRISRFQPELAGKITGMMLEMDNGELLMLLESDDSLKVKVDEALKVLESMGNARK
eukprot:GEMP01030733.1.p1 GENE.GEMP01030733.1~~GEMP01030733.1.p1  ORF type:complete len:370 (+),score=116.90 GEMP01030733.1:151-1110(+)